MTKILFDTSLSLLKFAFWWLAFRCRLWWKVEFYPLWFDRICFRVPQCFHAWVVVTSLIFCIGQLFFQYAFIRFYGITLILLHALDAASLLVIKAHTLLISTIFTIILYLFLVTYNVIAYILLFALVLLISLYHLTIFHLPISGYAS
jgi:hypothetical protein